MNLADVMDEIAAQVETITGLRVYAYPPDRVEPPAAIVSYPETYTFDETYGRGMDRLTLPLVIVEGKVSDRATKQRLAAWCDGVGALSVKQGVEAGNQNRGYSAFDDVHVKTIEFDVVTITGVDYMAALFTLDIAGPGT